MRVAMILSLGVLTTACVEDTTMGITVAPAQLPMGETCLRGGAVHVPTKVMPHAIGQ